MQQLRNLALSLIVIVASSGVALADIAPCDPGLHTRSPEQVWADRIDAIQRQDIEKVMCTYAPDAVVILPGNVAVGRDQIRPAMEGMFMLFGGVPPTMTSVTSYGEVLMVTFYLYAQMVSVPDGSDTYVIRNGYIQYQTVHDSMVFNAPPAQ